MQSNRYTIRIQKSCPVYHGNYIRGYATAGVTPYIERLLNYPANADHG